MEEKKPDTESDPHGKNRPTLGLVLSSVAEKESRETGTG